MREPNIYANFAIRKRWKSGACFNSNLQSSKAQPADLQNISLHIEYLLRTHDCVILPGIGAFLRTRRPASVSQEDGTISAPATQVCFNSSIVASDGLLCHSVARRNRVSFEEASVIVSNAAESCRKALTHDGELAIGRLGLLRVDEEKRISFQPYRTLFDRIWTSVSPVATSVQKTERDDAEQDVTTSDNNKYYVIRVSRRAIRYAAMMTVCLLTAATLMLPSANRSGSEMMAPRQYASVVPGVDKLTGGHASDASSHATNQVEAETETIDETAISDTDEADLYYLIVATFTKNEDCRKYIDMQPDSAELRVISNGKVSRVYSASSTDREELIATMTSASHKTLHPQSWIWEKPNAD